MAVTSAVIPRKETANTRISAEGSTIGDRGSGIWDLGSGIREGPECAEGLRLAELVGAGL
jgi:hypothetical protein